MMTETKTYCDHCGEELCYLNDYENIEIGLKTYKTADLCAYCMHELDSIIKKFCGKDDD